MYFSFTFQSIILKEIPGGEDRTSVGPLDPVAKTDLTLFSYFNRLAGWVFKPASPREPGKESIMRDLENLLEVFLLNQPVLSIDVSKSYSYAKPFIAYEQPHSM